MNLVEFLIETLDNLKATDITHFDVRKISSITDNMIVCTGTSSRQVSAMADNLITECKKVGIETFGDEGRNTADWIVVDFGQAIVHIMQREAREMYQLEKLWG
ncbi:ribosome silencing factor [Rodentibacter caecimuris]|uniref:Ribosomal silencing factor RsfS n=1 Tax=Rodentibacter caecimuris TaxID=1796644 RepID=A0ABX3L0J1_9PAST|nr:ribosome silencing factor [Rodentibacter heylii]